MAARQQQQQQADEVERTTHRLKIYRFIHIVWPSLKSFRSRKVAKRYGGPSASMNKNMHRIYKNIGKLKLIHNFRKG